jgi:hypothetical protein
MKSEIVYLGRDNSIDLLLKADGVAVDLSAASKMTLAFGTTLIESENGGGEPIRWAQSGYKTGEIRLKLGDESILPGNYRAPLIVHDPASPDGIHWGYIPIVIVAESGTSVEDPYDPDLIQYLTYHHASRHMAGGADEVTIRWMEQFNTDPSLESLVAEGVGRMWFNTTDKRFKAFNLIEIILLG